MAILHGLLFHWSAMTWFLGMDTRLRLSRERFERVMLQTTRKLFWRDWGYVGNSLVLSKGFQKCAFRNSIWRIVPSKILIFIRQMASCLHRQLAKCKFLIANGE
jgi:hypothetical protein